jgi:hypothetical protein
VDPTEAVENRADRFVHPRITEVEVEPLAIAGTAR